MSIVVILLTVLHITVCLILIAVVLLQTGKGADLANAFGGGGSQAALGPRSASNLMSKITTGAAVIFMISSLALALASSERNEAGYDYPEEGAAVEQPTTSPAPTEATPETEAAPAPSDDTGSGTE